MPAEAWKPYYGASVFADAQAPPGAFPPSSHSSAPHDLSVLSEETRAAGAAAERCPFPAAQEPMKLALQPLGEIRFRDGFEVCHHLSQDTWSQVVQPVLPLAKRSAPIAEA